MNIYPSCSTIPPGACSLNCKSVSQARERGGIDDHSQWKIKRSLSSYQPRLNTFKSHGWCHQSPKLHMNLRKKRRMAHHLLILGRWWTTPGVPMPGMHVPWPWTQSTFLKWMLFAKLCTIKLDALTFCYRSYLTLSGIDSFRAWILGSKLFQINRRRTLQPLILTNL